MSSFLDMARGAYSRLPPCARARLGHLAQLVPERAKWGPRYRQWRERIDSARADPALAGEHRNRARLAVVSAALDRSRYYAGALAPLLGPSRPVERLLEPDRWSEIPVISSADVRMHAADMCTCPIETLDVGSTGGTSGNPVKFYLDKGRSPIEYAFVHDAWSRAGFRAGDLRCVFRGVELDRSDEPHMQYDRGLAELRCSVFHLDDETMRGYREQICALGIRFVHGYPSAIAIFAEFLVRTGGQLPQVEGVFPTSERLYASQLEIIAQAFVGARIVPFYGLSEKNVFACARVDDPDVYDLDPLYGYAELLDQHGAPVTVVGERGRLVSTGLIFHGMPFIRYDTGDTAELVALPDVGNGYRLAVRGITPKHGTEFLLGSSGALIGVKGIISNLQGTAYGIREYQFYQDTRGEVLVRIVPLADETADFSAYRDLLARKMAGELRVSVEVVDHIALTGRGKRKLVEQRLDLTHAGTDLQGRRALIF
jgi:phenylacetate-CoA ligase